ncbi:MAG: hypothetical protein K0R81_1605 [Microbacterium sp.]|nr:hypothetical protein [Microbacterium sp.]
MSAPAASAAAIASRGPSPSSPTLVRSTTSAPDSSARPARSTLFDSGICPRRSGSPAGCNSEPVDTTATRGARDTDTVPTPAAAIAPRRAAVSRTPAATTSSPSRTSEPRRRIWAPGPRGAASTVTSPRPPESPRSVSSNGTTAVASVGTGAPVMMRAASPASILGSRSVPAGRSATTRSVAGRAPSSRTAKPSIAELSNPGTSTLARTGCRSTRPSADPTARVSGATGTTRSRTAARCSATSIMRSIRGG